MSWICPRCLQPVFFAEKVSSLGKNWHRFCLKCEHCHNVLSPGGHAEVRLGWVAQPCACHQLPVSAPSAHHHQPRQPTPQIELPTRHHTIQYLGSLSCAGGSHAFCQHNGRPYCHKPCYGVLFGPRGVNIGGVGSYLYRSPAPIPASITPLSPSSFSSPRPRPGLPQGKKSPPYMKTFTGETSLCPGCEEPVYFAEKVMSLGRNWHRPCLRCQRCRKTLTAGSHAEHDGVPYCHIPCYGYLFGPKGVNIGDVGCYIYDPVEIKSK